jgi:hypothetical protein
LTDWLPLRFVHINVSYLGLVKSAENKRILTFSNLAVTVEYRSTQKPIVELNFIRHHHQLLSNEAKGHIFTLEIHTADPA